MSGNSSSPIFLSALRPLRLLHCTAGYAPAWTLGGPPRSSANLCEGLAARGHQVVVFTTKLGLSDRPDLPDGELVQRNGVTVHYFPLTGGPGIRSAPLAAAVAARAGEFDLMHVTGVWQPTSIPACRAAVRRGVPYVMSPRGALSEYSFSQKRLKKALYWWLYERQQLNGAAAVHYTALVEQDECRRLQPRAPGFVVPNSIDLQAWRHDAAAALAWRRRHGLARDDFIFLSSGRLHHKKGLELLVAAVTRLPRDREWKLVFAGPDEDGTGVRLRRLGQEAGLTDRLLFTGALDTAEMSAAYSAAGLFLFPSRNENFGNVAVEALACGTRVALAPGVGCWRELNDTPGVVVLPREVKAWHQEMALALNRMPLSDRVLSERRQAFERRYSGESVAAAMEAAYHGVLARNLATQGAKS
jgi:glycosyltransferase involved in cell wall biosynthesis